MVKAVGELALAGVGIIPAIEPSRGYIDMVPFNPLLETERSRKKRKGLMLFDDYLLADT